MTSPRSNPTIAFHGASGTVTGSCFLLTLGENRVLVDCGMFQGSKTEKELNYRPFPFAPGSISAAILTHAHIDHSGLLPKLAKEGFTGPIYCTRATLDLCSVMLPDSGHIQEMEVEQLNRRNKRRGKSTVDPIYTAADAMATLVQMEGLPYKQWKELSPTFRFRFWNAGHLLGSGSVEVEVGADHERQRILFSGDIGPHHKLLQFDPEAPSGWDYAICESTYGNTDRLDPSGAGRQKMLRDEVCLAARHRDGALLIPSFAVERTQELLADLVDLMRRGEIIECPIIIDSPLASRATEVFKRHSRELENGDLLLHAIGAKNVRFTETAEQSKAVDNIKGFHIVIAASGMCEAGRIRHRLKNWLWREEGTVLLVGYQANGTLGRLLADGSSTVKIQGDEIAVRAAIRKLDVYSGHADGPELEEWIMGRKPIGSGVFLVHGELPAIAGLKDRLARCLPDLAILEPAIDTVYELGPQGAVLLSAGKAVPRLSASQVGRADWHNDLQTLVLDLQDHLDHAADEKSRSAILRKVRRSLSDDV